jgi:glucosamine--fructose-6-phosphate aminotransferase (isomerizing)
MYCRIVRERRIASDVLIVRIARPHALADSKHSPRHEGESMCGIFGYVGTERNVPVTVGAALKSLEYRGYDSWGIVWREADRLETVKRIGKVPTSFTFDAISKIAVGHTRWATHGGVTDANAHPHLDASGRIAIVHNGIVENADTLRAELHSAPPFASETDSEIIAHLLGERVELGASIVDALRAVFPLLKGQNAVIAIDQREEVIAAAMNVSPLVIGIGGEGSYISSDPFALVGKAPHMIIAPNDAVVRLDESGVTAIDFYGREVPMPDPHPVPEVSLDELGPFDHFMAKEMAEQPGVLALQLADTVSSERLAKHIDAAGQVILVGCGTAFYAARIGATWLSTLAGVRAIATPASEFAEVQPYLNDQTLVLAITQSGETADILEAMRSAADRDCRVVALVNVVHSSAARMADDVIPLLAGRERSVLATKSMTGMLGRLMIAASILALETPDIGDVLDRASSTIQSLNDSDDLNDFVERTSERIAGCEHVYIIGKGTGYGVAQEAALKIKEASYVHAEAFASGELKHGAIALVEPGTPCIVFATDLGFVADTNSSAQELKSRGGYTIGIGLEIGPGVVDGFCIPDHGPANGLVQIYIAQRIAYRVALLRHLDPDYPRNLAKSVTVK